MSLGGGTVSAVDRRPSYPVAPRSSVTANRGAHYPLPLPDVGAESPGTRGNGDGRPTMDVSARLGVRPILTRTTTDIRLGTPHPVVALRAAPYRNGYSRSIRIANTTRPSRVIAASNSSQSGCSPLTPR